MTDWREDLATLLSETTGQAAGDILGSGGAQWVGRGVASDPADYLFKTLDLPASVARGGVGSLVNVLQGEGLGGIEQGQRQWDEAMGGFRQADLGPFGILKTPIELAANVAVDPTTYTGLGLLGRGARGLRTASEAATLAGRPGVSTTLRTAARGAQAAQTINDLPAQVILPPVQAAFRQAGRGLERARPNILATSERSLRSQRNDELRNMASALSVPRDPSVIGTAELPLRMPPPRRRSTADLLPPLRAQLDDLGLTDIGLKLVRDLREINPAARAGADSPYQDQALYRGREKLIAISLEAASADDMPRLVDHEAIHAIRDLGLFQANEFDTLVRAADEMGLRASVTDLYPRASGDRLAEEMVSALYVAHRSGTPIPEQARSILQRMVDFLRRFGLAAPDVTPRAVLRRIDAGEIGRRPRTGAGGAADDAMLRVYHGSGTPGLSTLQAERPLKDRVFPNAASTFGVFTTLDRKAARDYAQVAAFSGDDWTTKPITKRVYSADVNLTNPHTMPFREFEDRYVSRRPERFVEAEAFKETLIAQGHDGIHLVDDAGNVKQVVSFSDVPVAAEDAFARRRSDPAAQKIRDSLEADGVRLADRDPSFFPRFRSLVEGKEPEEVVRTLSTPVARPDAPSLLALAPDWDQRSQERLDRAIEWASRPKSEGGYGPAAVQTALRSAPDLAPPPGRLYDQMLRMPIGHLLWYYLSGMAVDEIQGLTPEQARKFVGYIAATSPGETPFTNLKLGTAVMSEDLRGRPGWVGMRNTSQVERVAQGVGLGGPKTDDFAMEIAQRSRALRDPDTGALPVIDLWQARAYHLPDADAVGKSDPLFAIIARHTIEENDELQRLMGPYLESFAGAPLTLEPNMTQAGLWVLGRENDGLYGKALATPDFTRGSDYWSAMRQMERGLNEKLPSVAATGPTLTVRDLMNPALANELTNYGIVNYEEGRHILTEFATSNTLPGVRTQQLLLNAEQLPPDHSVRRQLLNGFNATAAEVRAGAPRTVPGVYQITRGLFKQAAESGVFDEMAAALMRIPPGKLDVGRINYRAYGSWEGTLSPHIDIPTMGRIGNELVIFPQEVIERMMMGIAQAWRQDMAAANAWSTVGINAADANSRIIHLPGVHFDEEVGGSIKAMPAELARVGEITRASGWPTQVVSSPLMSLVKLIDPRSPDMPRLGDADLLEAIHDAGYTGQIDFVDSVHTSLTAEADPEVGYAALIANPDLARDRAGGIADNFVAGLSGTYPARPVGGSVPGSDWGGEPRQRFRDAVASLRRYADTATERLAAAEPWHRRRVAAEVGSSDLPWKVDPDLASRESDLAVSGGTSPNFPLGEDAFARVAARALGVSPDDPVAKVFADFDPRLTIEQNELLESTVTVGKQSLTYKQFIATHHLKARSDMTALREAGVSWGVYASPEQRISAAGGDAKLEAIIADWNKEGIDILAAGDPNQVAVHLLGKAIDKEEGVEATRNSAYDLFRAAWGEQALLSPKYHTGNFSGAWIQNALAGVLTNPFATGREVWSALKAIRAGSDQITKQEALASMKATQIAQKWGLEGMPVEVMRGGIRALTMGEEIHGPSAMGEVVGRLTRSETLGRKAGWIFAANNDFALALDTATRGPVWSQTLDDAMEREMVAWEAEVARRGQHIPGFDPARPPDLRPDAIKRHLTDQGMQDGVAENLMRSFVHLRGNALKEARTELNRVQFYGSRTNLDEMVGKIVPFHYWISRATRYYFEEAVRHPFLVLNYMRLSDGMEDAQNDPGLSARQKGFIRILGTPLGFSLLMNPDALFGVTKVFGLTESYEADGQTELGGAIAWMKNRGVGLYPWIDGTINMLGMYGNTFEPDLLGIRHKALVGAAVQFVRAELDLDPAAAPYANAMGQARYGVSSFVSGVLPWLAEPVTPRAGGSSQEATLDTLIESVIIEGNPGLTNQQLLDIMSDPDSDPYEDAYRTVSEAGLTTQLLNFTAPVRFTMRHDARDVRAAQVDVVQEEADRLGKAPWEVAPTLDDVDFLARYKALTGKDYQPGDYESAKLDHDLSRAPLVAKPLLLAEAEYHTIGSPKHRGHYEAYYGLLKGDDPAVAGMSAAGRQEMAARYLDSHPRAREAVDAIHAQRDAYEQAHPEFAEFRAWQGRMDDLRTQLGGSLTEYRRQASEQNPNAARYFAEQWAFIARDESDPAKQLERFEQATRNMGAFVAITGKADLRSVQGPFPGTPPVDVTLPNMQAPSDGYQGYNQTDWRAQTRLVY